MNKRHYRLLTVSVPGNSTVSGYCLTLVVVHMHCLPTSIIRNQPKTVSAKDGR